MKAFNIYSTIVSLFLSASSFAQVKLDNQLRFAGTGNNARIVGIDSVAAASDVTNVKVVQNGSLIYALATGSSNNFNLNISPPITGYGAGMVFNFMSNQNITGPATLNVDNLGAKPIKKNITGDLATCDIQNMQMVTVVYDGANFQITSLLPSNTPPTPGVISGTNTVCPNAAGLVYSINPVSGAISYNWTVPAGDTIVANNGTSVTVNFGMNPAGNITVSATNNCGTGALSTLAILNPGAISATAAGATVTNVSGYTYYTFADTGTFTFTVNGCGGNVDVLVVAGGGGGGGNGGGGGGGGGIVYQSNYPVSTGSYSVIVGAGGTGQVDMPPDNGGNSFFDTLVAVGGGGGGSRDSYSAGNTGGSGGGAGGTPGGGAAGSDTLNQGYPGGLSSNSATYYDYLCSSSGGGGGGAGSMGGGGSSGRGGGGGNGASYFGNTYGGGGGGGVTCSPGAGGTGGTGGGGAGSSGAAVGGTNGYGGGGGGGGNGANGGSGVVIIRYLQ